MHDNYDSVVKMSLKNNIITLKSLVIISMGWLLILPVLAQTCNTAIKSTTPNDRYLNNGDGTITDLTTKLMWKRCSEGQLGLECNSGTDVFTAGDPVDFDWDESLQYIENLNSSGGYAGYSNWRLPNRKELESLVEESCFSPAININQFPNTPNSFYWSSSRYPSNTIFAWGVSFGDGNSFPSFSTQVPIRLVRSFNM